MKEENEMPKFPINSYNYNGNVYEFPRFLTVKVVALQQEQEQLKKEWQEKDGKIQSEIDELISLAKVTSREGKVYQSEKSKSIWDKLFG